MEDKKLKQTQTNKLSTVSFKARLKSEREAYLLAKKGHIERKNKELLKAKTKQERHVILKTFKKRLRNSKNRYALTYNAIRNEELYRKGALEIKIGEVNAKYKKKRSTSSKFNAEVENAKRKEKIAKLKVTYTKPISKRYRKKRSVKEEDDIKEFFYIPVNMPYMRYLKSFSLIVFAALISTLALDIFIKPFGIYNAGLRGLTQMGYYAIKHYKPETETYMSYVLFAAANIPLAIFGYLFVGKKFSIYTIAMIGLQYLFSQTFVSTGFEDNIKPFGLNANEISKIVNSTKNDQPIYKFVLPIISAIIGAILYGFAIGMIYRAGGSTGGSKFVVTWFAIKKDISIGKVALGFSIFVIFTGLLVNKVILQGEKFVSVYSSITLFATLSFTFVSNMTLDRVYAKSKKVNIDVVTSKKTAILKFLDTKYMYGRTFSVTKVATNFDGKQKHRIRFLVTQVESEFLMKMFSTLDPHSLVTETVVKKTKGRFYSQWFE